MINNMSCPPPIAVDKCGEGTLLLPILDEATWNQGFRTFLYLIALLWCFMGVAIIADVFMCAIETITSKTKVVMVAKQGGSSNDMEEVHVRVWNDTVANLTLMALGSSAPEILLAIIEITILNKFESGALGPSTIVGSAAFNLLVITGVCVMAIPTHEVRRIKSIKVFGVTATFCILAYVWLYVALSVSSPDIMDMWEAILTFLLFPILIVIAFIADKEYCCPERVSPEDTGALELAEGSKVFTQSTHDPEVESFIKEVSRNPVLSEDDAAKLVAAHIKSKEPKNYGYYRVSSIRNIAGAQKLRPKMDSKLKVIYEELSEVGFSSSGASVVMSHANGLKQPAIIEFQAPKCAVLESDKLVKIGVTRSGNLTTTATVSYETIDGTATAESDYVTKKDVMVFKPGEKLKFIDITIIDDNEWEENEVFFVKLLPYDYKDLSVKIGKQSVTEVTIINDDEPGLISLDNPSYLLKESIGKAQIRVDRCQGTDGKVSVTWRTIDQTAVNGKDYHGGAGTVTFEHGEQVRYIDIDIIDDKDFEKDETFVVEISDPTGGAQLGKVRRAVVTIVNDEEYRHLFDRVVALTHLNLRRLELGSESWGMQFRQAMSVNGGDIENATSMDYVMHFFTFFWKILFALVPPCSWCGGWLTFGVALMFIGFLTTIVGDLATIFGCLIDLKPEATAIMFVALGTSLPDLFASRTAAISEKYADAAVGNVTGSNSVNVFLGLGVPWVIASIYHAVKGDDFKVPAGSLSVSVVTYIVCALLCLGTLMVRRCTKALGRAELGGPKATKVITGIFFISLWFIYVLVSCLVIYEVVAF